MNPLYKAGLTGRGKTIVLVDSYGSPTIHERSGDVRSGDRPAGSAVAADHHAGRNHPPPYDQTNYDMGNWGFETSLDVEYSHAMAPGANILLVETPVDETLGVQGFPQMIEAENYVIDHHLGDVISQSFGATEQTFPSHVGRSMSLRSAYFNALLHRVTVLASSGDGGATDDSAYNPSNGAVELLHVPRRGLAVQRPAGDVGRRNPAAPRPQWQPHRARQRLERHGVVRRSRRRRRRRLQRVQPAVLSRTAVGEVVGSARGSARRVASARRSNGGVDVYLGYTNTACRDQHPAGTSSAGRARPRPLFSGIVAHRRSGRPPRPRMAEPDALRARRRFPRSPITDITLGNNSVAGIQQLPPDAGTPFSVTGFNTTTGVRPGQRPRYGGRSAARRRSDPLPVVQHAPLELAVGRPFGVGPRCRSEHHAQQEAQPQRQQPEREQALDHRAAQPLRQDRAELGAKHHPD